VINSDGETCTVGYKDELKELKYLAREKELREENDPIVLD